MRFALCIWLAAAIGAIGTAGPLRGQADGTPGPRAVDAAPQPTAEPAPEKVDVLPLAEDAEIAARLQKILDATGWFTQARVSVDEGVVFLSGHAKNAEVKEWAGALARRTQDVVAVVNQLEIEETPFWNLTPATAGLRELGRETIALLPFFAFGTVIFLITLALAWLTAKGTRRGLTPYIDSALLRDVLARTAGIAVIVLGLYVVLRVFGLTRLALTILGGTGILGLVIGIAFRDITENFLASIILSMRRPFLVGDLVEIVGVLGYVQRLTTRATSLMTLNGNHVEIPNATVYKNTIRNFSTNKNRRDDFTVGIGYDVPIAKAQEVALAVLRDHPAILKEPEPWALADSFGASVIVLRIYYWLDGSQHSAIKVRSSVIRLIKRAFCEADIDMPDEAREVILPKGVHVRLTREKDSEPAKGNGRRWASSLDAAKAEEASTTAEGGLDTDAGAIREQARQSRRDDDDSNLLEPQSKAT